MQFQPMLNDAERQLVGSSARGTADYLASKYAGNHRVARLALANGFAALLGVGPLSEAELATCRSMDISPEDFIRSKLSRSAVGGASRSIAASIAASRSFAGSLVAVCASESAPIIPSRQSLMRAHGEIDRAHAADADAGWRDTPIPTLISRGLDGLGALDMSTESSWLNSYNDFAIGVMNLMRALQLASPDPEAEKLHAPASPALMRAHDDIDRAHGAALTQDVDGQWQNVPIPELIGAAASGVKAYKPGVDSTFDDLLLGTLNAMRALELVVPAYINRKPFPGEK